jgi:hypothetical protein
VTPEQLTRRRASRDRWRERNPQEWRVRRVRQRSGSPGAGPPDPPPDRSPDAELAELRSRVAQLEAALADRDAELAELRAYRQRNVERSRRNHQRRSPDRPPPAATGHRPAATGTPPLARDVQSGPPPESTNYPGVSLSTTTSATVPETRMVVVASGTAPSESVWSDATVLEAVASRPGLDARLLQRRVGDWLERNPHCRLTVSTVLSFIERWRPSIDNAPQRAFSEARRGASGGDESPASLDWIAEAEKACVAEQDRLLAAAGIV